MTRTQTAVPDVAERRRTPQDRPPEGRRRGRRETLAGYLFLTPWCVGVLLLTLGPMLVSLYLAFTDYNLFDSPKWTGLRNFRDMFADDRWWHSVRVTLEYVLVGTPLKLAAALAVALLLVRPRRGQGFYRSAFYAPSLIGASVSIGIVWRSVFQDDAVVDRALHLAGWDVGGWVGDPDWSLPTLVTLTVWQFGAPMVIFLAGLKQVPRELYEAAEVDGAGAWRRFRSITLPLISPVLFFNLLLELIHSFQVFTSAVALGGSGGGAGGPADSLLVYTWYLYEQGFRNLRMGYASAMAWMLMLGIGLLTALLFRTQRSWVHYVTPAATARRRTARTLAWHAGALTLLAVILYPVVWLVGASLKPGDEIVGSLELLPGRPIADNYRRLTRGIADIPSPPSSPTRSSWPSVRWWACSSPARWRPTPSPGSASPGASCSSRS